jgi:TPR repeat protein
VSGHLHRFAALAWNLPNLVELGTSMGQSECGATGVSSVRGEVRQDYAEAFRWFQKGAVANDSDAQTNDFREKRHHRYHLNGSTKLVLFVSRNPSCAEPLRAACRRKNCRC